MGRKPNFDSMGIPTKETGFHTLPSEINESQLQVGGFGKHRTCIYNLLVISLAFQKKAAGSENTALAFITNVIISFITAAGVLRQGSKRLQGSDAHSKTKVEGSRRTRSSRHT